MESLLHPRRHVFAGNFWKFYLFSPNERFLRKLRIVTRGWRLIVPHPVIERDKEGVPEIKHGVRVRQILPEQRIILLVPRRKGRGEMLQTSDEINTDTLQQRQLVLCAHPIASRPR